ncbi:MAG: hypothetical protein R3E68_20430 [Burkholderiaceae bacterium]
MNESLAGLGYVQDADTGVWRKPGFTGISYSDGDEVETRIGAAIDACGDRRVLSGQLRRHCIDWPSRYHLSAVRANLLRPFEPSLSQAGAEVLEIGAGCGAITRYLGECGARVLALEGSLRRASIARRRTAGLNNVTVLAEDFNRFDTAQRFDVTLIGVLEYATLFVGSEHPSATCSAGCAACRNPVACWCWRSRTSWASSTLPVRPRITWGC